MRHRLSDVILAAVLGRLVAILPAHEAIGEGDKPFAPEREGRFGFLVIPDRAQWLGAFGLSAAPPPFSTDKPRRYVVGKGDTLWRIALHFGVNVGDIARANGLPTEPVLSDGMELIIPFSNEVGAARANPAGGDPLVNGRGLHFVVSIARTTCWLYRDGVRIERWTCSPGRPDSPSAPGNYTVQSKLPQAYSLPADFYMPFWLGIYDGDPITENGIHGLPFSAKTGERAWTDKIGVPITYGCIMLDDAAARYLYNLADIGMAVTILP